MVLCIMYKSYIFNIYLNVYCLMWHCFKNKVPFIREHIQPLCIVIGFIIRVYCDLPDKIKVPLMYISIPFYYCPFYTCLSEPH